MFVTPMESADSETVETIARWSGTKVDVAAELDRGWGLPWVVRDAPNQPPVAFLIAWRAADELHVIDIATHPDHRRRGAARALLLALIAFGRENGFRLVVLEVRASNRPARELYISLGFTVARVRRNYYAEPDEDGVDMLLELDTHTEASDGSSGPAEATS
jgi:[ribosomal protein S18]-alanine N-acetyltransferase